MKDTVTLGKLIEQKESIFTVSEVAERLKVHPDTIRRWVKSGRMKCLRHPINNYRIFVLNELMEFLNNGEIK